MNSDDITKNLDDHGLLLHLVSLVREFGDCLQSLENRQQAVEDRLLQSLENRQQSVEDRLQSLEQKVDERLYDTRPIWETVQLQISELREQMATGEEMAKGFRKLDSKWEMLAREVRDLYADERELERRVGNLESKVS